MAHSVVAERNAIAKSGMDSKIVSWPAAAI